METTPLNVLEKGNNQIRFKSFSDRLRLIGLSETPRRNMKSLSEEETHFRTALDLHSVTNLTDSFVSLRRNVFPLSRSLPIILANKTELVNLILKSLKNRDETPCHKESMELLVALSKDLGTEFPCIGDTLSTLFGLAEPNQPELMEKVFNTIAALSKFLFEPITAQLSLFLKKHFLSCLTSKRIHLRNFSAETFAYLLRRQSLPERKKFIRELLFVDLKKTESSNKIIMEDYCDGVARVLSNCIKVTKSKEKMAKKIPKTFRKNSKAFVNLLFSLIKEEKDVSENCERLSLIFSNFYRLCIEHQKSRFKLRDGYSNINWSVESSENLEFLFDPFPAGEFKTNRFYQNLILLSAINQFGVRKGFFMNEKIIKITIETKFDKEIIIKNFLKMDEKRKRFSITIISQCYFMLCDTENSKTDRELIENAKGKILETIFKIIPIFVTDLVNKPLINLSKDELCTFDLESFANFENDKDVTNLKDRMSPLQSSLLLLEILLPKRFPPSSEYGLSKICRRILTTLDLSLMANRVIDLKTHLTLVIILNVCDYWEENIQKWPLGTIFKENSNLDLLIKDVFNKDLSSSLSCLSFNSFESFESLLKTDDYGINLSLLWALSRILNYDFVSPSILPKEILKMADKFMQGEKNGKEEILGKFGDGLVIKGNIKDFEMEERDEIKIETMALFLSAYIDKIEFNYEVNGESLINVKRMAIELMTMEPRLRSSIYLMEKLKEIFEMAEICGNTKISRKNSQDEDKKLITKALSKSLLSFSVEDRRRVIILMRFYCGEYNVIEKILQILTKLYSLQLSFETERDFIKLLDRLSTEISLLNDDAIQQFYKFLLSALIGLLNVKFSVVWIKTISIASKFLINIFNTPKRMHFLSQTLTNELLLSRNRRNYKKILHHSNNSKNNDINGIKHTNNNDKKKNFLKKDIKNDLKNRLKSDINKEFKRILDKKNGVDYHIQPINHSENLLSLFEEFFDFKYNLKLNKINKLNKSNKLNKLNEFGMAEKNKTEGENKIFDDFVTTFKVLVTSAHFKTDFKWKDVDDFVSYCATPFKDKNDIKELVAYLKVFSKTQIIYQLDSNEFLKRIFLTLLRNENKKIQELSLQTLFLWKEEHLILYKNSLLDLIAPKKAKKGYLNFGISKNVSGASEKTMSGKGLKAIPNCHREKVLYIVFNLFLPLIVSSKKENSRKKSALNFLSSLEKSELIYFLTLIWKHFESVKKTKNVQDLSMEDLIIEKKKLEILGLFFKHFRVLRNDTMTEPTSFDFYLVIENAFRKAMNTLLNPAMKEISSINGKSKKILLLCHSRTFDFTNYLKMNKINPFIEKYLSNCRVLNDRSLIQNPFSKREKTFIQVLLSLVENMKEEQEELLKLLKLFPVQKFIMDLLLNKTSHKIQLISFKIIENLTDSLNQKSPFVSNASFLIILKLLSNFELDPESKGLYKTDEINETDKIEKINELNNKIRPFANPKSKLAKAKESLSLKLGPFCKTKDEFEIYSKIILGILKRKERIFGNLGMVEKICNAIPHSLEFKNVVGSVWNGLARLFLKFPSTSEEIKKLVLIYETLSKKDWGNERENKEIFERIADLNAMIDNRVDDQIDYDKRMATYLELKTKLKTFNLERISPLINIFLRDSKGSDFAIRSVGGELIFKFINDFSKKEKNEKNEKNQKINKEKFETNLNKIVGKIILPAVFRMVKLNSSIDSKRSASKILQTIVFSVNESGIKDLGVLVNRNADLNFFENLFHIQSHRRRKAISRLCQVGTKAKFSSESVSKILLPLLLHFAFNISERKKEGTPELAVKAIGYLVKNLEWKEFLLWARFLTRNITEHPSIEKIMVQIICVFVDNFSFEKRLRKMEINLDLDIDVDIDIDIKNKIEKIDKKVENDNKSKNGDNVECVERKEFLDLRSFLKGLVGSMVRFCVEEKEREFKEKGRVLQKLMDGLKSASLKVKDKEMIKARVSIAIVKILLVLPEKKDFEMQLKVVLIELCNSLKNRQQKIRDELRKSLGVILGLIGPKKLMFLLTFLEKTLSKGYQRQVLAYTVHYLLKSASEHFKHGEIDYALPELSKIAFENIFGEPSETFDKTVNSPQIKESSSAKGPDCYRLIAKKIDFSLSFNSLLSSLLSSFSQKFENKMTENQRRKLNEVLKCILKGFSENEDIRKVNVLVFVYQVLKKLIHLLSKHNSEIKKMEETPIMTQKGLERITKKEHQKEESIKETELKRMNILGEFSLKLFYLFLKKNKNALKSQNGVNSLWRNVGQIASFLEFFLENESKRPSVAAFCSVDRKVVLKICRLLFSVEDLQIGGSFGGESAKGNFLDSLAPKVTSFCFDNLVSGAKEINTSVFPLLSATLKKNKKALFNHPEKAELLLGFIEEHLTDSKLLPMALSLLKILVGFKIRRKRLPKLIFKVQNEMVKSGSIQSRKLSSKCVVLFLANFEVTEKRLNKHITHLVANTSFEFPEGRLISIQTLKSFIKRASSELLTRLFEQLFFPLTVAIANEVDEPCLKESKSAVEELCLRAPKQKTLSVAKHVEEWIGSERFELQCSALKLLDTLLSPFSKIKSLPKLFPVLDEVLSFLKIGENDSESENNWKKTYLSVEVLKTLLKTEQNKDSTKSKNKTHFGNDHGNIVRKWLNEADLTNRSLSLLNHSHFWVRNSALALLNLNLRRVFLSKQIGQKWQIGQNGQNGKGLSIDRKMLESVLESTECDHFDAEYGEQVRRFLGIVFRIWLESGNERGVLEGAFTERLKWVFEKLEKIANKGNLLKKKLFVGFAKSVCGFPKESGVLVDSVSLVILRSLWVYSERMAGKDNVNKALTESFGKECKEAIQKVREIIGEERYLKLYFENSSKKGALKAKRKRKFLTERVSRQEKASKTLIKSNKRKALSKKRKKVGKKRMKL